jgi:hypothetical protein
MPKAIHGAAACAVILIGLIGCLSAPKPRGPVDSFAFVAGTNKTLAANVVGAINPATDPQEIRVTVPPGTDMHSLVATLSLNTEAVITVISSGARVVQENGVTPNDFSVPVTYAVEVPKDKKPWTYKVFVREAETNAQLGTLAVPPGAVLAPQFSPAVHSYTVLVPYAVTSVQVRVGGQSRTLRSITVDGMVLPGVSGTATVPFQSVQERTISIESLAEDGVTRAQYTVTIQRAAPDRNSSLGALDLGQVPLLPSFSPGQMSYQATVAFAARQMVIHARPQSPVATVTLSPAAAEGSGAGAGQPAFHGNPADTAGAVVDLPPDPSTAIVVMVTAEDGSVQQYLLDVQRAPPDHNADLASLTVSAGTLTPPFSARVPQYTVALPASAENVTLTAAASSPVAVVTLAGQPGNPVGGQAVTVPVAPGASVMVTFAVRAEDGFQRQYRVLLNRPQDANALLQSLQLGGAQLAPAFTPSVILYDVKLPAEAQSFTIQAAAQSKLAAVAVDGRPAGGAPLTLGVPAGGTRIVVIDVTAQNGTVVRYTLRTAREAPAPVTPPPVQPAPPQPAAPAPVQPAAPQSAAPQPAAPPLTMPPDSGSAHVVIAARGLKLGAREAAAMAAAGDQAGTMARITVRAYRTETVITQYPAPVQAASQGKETVIALNARSNGVTLGRDRMVEVQIVIPTKVGKLLYYTEAQPADDEVRVEVPFLLYGDNPRIGWPAAGTMVPVSGVVSSLPQGKERAADNEDFPRNAKGAVAVTVQLADAATGLVYGSQIVASTSGPQRERLLSFGSPILVPEGATVRYLLSATAKNGKVWTATGTAQAWTTDPAYPSGFQPVLIAVSDDLQPGGR